MAQGLDQEGANGASRLLLEDIVQGSPVPTFVIDGEHRVVHWNRACEVILGYPAERMLGTRDQWRAFYPTERPVMADLVVSGEIDQVGRYYQGKFRRSNLVPGSFEAEDFFPAIGDGGTWLYFTAAPIHDAEGRVVGAIETLQDITARKRAEAAEQEARASLQVSHDRLRTIVEHFPCGVSVIDKHFDLVECNAEFKALLDFPESLFDQARTPLERIFRFNAERGEYGPGDPDRQVKFLMERSMRLDAHSFERVRPNGTILEIRGTPLPGGGLITSYTDVTERRRIERRIAELLTEHQVIFQNAQVGIVWLKERRIINCNPKMAEIFGFSSAEAMIGLPTRHIYCSDQAWEFDGKHVYAQLAESGSIEGETSGYCTADGKPLCLFRTGSLLDTRDPQGGSIWTFTDITDYKRQESELRLSGVVFDNASEAFVVTDREVGIITVNHAFERLTGYSRAEVVGKNPRILRSGVHPDDFYREMWATLAEKGKWSGEVWDRCKDGSIAPFSLAIAAVTDSSGAVSNYISTFSDISARKRAEAALLQLNVDLEDRVSRRTAELQRALETVKKTQEELARADRMAALGALVAGVSHELNTPIGNCVTVASTLLDQAIGFEQSYQAGPLRRKQFEDFLQAAKLAAELLLRGMQKAQRLVAEFKQVASDQSGEQRRSFDLREVISALASLLMPTLRKHGVTMEFDIPAGVRLDSYPGLIEQVVSNLVNNALLHAFDDCAEARVLLTATAGEDHVQLEFSDNGAGIPDEVIGRIFDPFYTTKLGQGGTGLGLNIVYNIVTGPLGGTVAASSVSGRGARFSVLIPRVAPVKGS